MCGGEGAKSLFYGPWHFYLSCILLSAPAEVSICGKRVTLFHLCESTKADLTGPSWSQAGSKPEPVRSALPGLTTNSLKRPDFQTGRDGHHI